jgi:DNA-binding response OmpR family regulator
MTRNKNILIVIDNGIIALDLKNQLNASGYNAEIINPGNQDKLRETLSRGVQLIIFEKSVRVIGLEYATGVAQNYRLPAIYLSTDTENDNLNCSDLSIVTIPFSENELKEAVKNALEENR